MPDLHGWISQKIAASEERAKACPPWPWTFDADEEAVLAADGLQVADVFALSNRQLRAVGDFIAANDPATVLRRCTADRKTLEIHCYSGGSYEPYACNGCGHDDMGALVDHCNDCETLQALAEGYGITDEELAQLDRPEPVRPVNLYKSYADQMDAYCRRLDHLLRPTNPTSAVPAALRGPNWKPRPTA
ncbi:DUF6221 family protein [Streptomyces sp. NPDC059456]|uniref:DUF6221 family protein n=1 Tax=Streptomyces sp. NPDC059456 TaxID=3346838 RepID=UPI0036943BC7